MSIERSVSGQFDANSSSHVETNIRSIGRFSLRRLVPFRAPEQTSPIVTSPALGRTEQRDLLASGVVQVNGTHPEETAQATSGHRKDKAKVAHATLVPDAGAVIADLEGQNASLRGDIRYRDRIIAQQNARMRFFEMSSKPRTRRDFSAGLVFTAAILLPTGGLGVGYALGRYRTPENNDKGNPSSQAQTTASHIDTTQIEETEQPNSVPTANNAKEAQGEADDFIGNPRPNATQLVLNAAKAHDISVAFNNRTYRYFIERDDPEHPGQKKKEVLLELLNGEYKIGGPDSPIFAFYPTATQDFAEIFYEEIDDGIPSFSGTIDFTPQFQKVPTHIGDTATPIYLIRTNDQQFSDVEASIKPLRGILRDAVEAIGPLDPGIVYVAPDQIYDTTDPYKLIVEDGITKGVAINAAILKPLPAEQQIRVLQEGQLMAALHRIKINEQTKHDPDIIALNPFLDAYQNAYDMAESTNSGEALAMRRAFDAIDAKLGVTDLTMTSDKRLNDPYLVAARLINALSLQPFDVVQLLTEPDCNITSEPAREKMAAMVSTSFALINSKVDSVIALEKLVQRHDMEFLRKSNVIDFEDPIRTPVPTFEPNDIPTPRPTQVMTNFPTDTPTQGPTRERATLPPEATHAPTQTATPCQTW